MLDMADWNEGPTRAAGLLLFAAALAFAGRGEAAPSRASRPLLAAALAAALLRLVPALAGLPRAEGPPNDIGWTTARAVQALRGGASPYASLVDPQRDLPRREPGFGWFMGYKYGPLVARYYAPFLDEVGYPRGLYLGNAVVLAATALLVSALAARAAGLDAALAAAAALLWPQFARFELFSQGVNDLLPTALALAALAAAALGRGLVAGLALGLSLAAKPLPGALFLALLPGTVRAAPLALGVALGLLPYAPHALRAPRELVANLVLFNVLRPGDSTGATFGLPPWAAPAAQSLAVAGCAAVAVAYHRGRRTARDLVVAAALFATLFLAGGKLIHRNYLLWWLPLAAAAMGAAFHPRPAPGVPSPGTRR
jgi:hypothetical protein